MLLSTKERMANHMNGARAKHPGFARNRWHFACIMIEEVCEVLKALFWEGDPKRVEEELCDLAAVCGRGIERDGYLGEGEER